MGIATAYGEFHGADLPGRLLVSHDGGYGERFEYLLTGIAGMIMLFVGWKTHVRAYLALAVLFGLLTADNALSLHENFGAWSAPIIKQAGITDNAQHYGEFAFMLCFGLFMLGVILAAEKSSDEQHRNRVLLMIMLVTCAAGFGVGMDMIDTILLTPGTAAVAISIFVEDAGELWCISATAIGAIAIAARIRREQARHVAPAPPRHSAHDQRVTATPPL